MYEMRDPDGNVQETWDKMDKVEQDAVRAILPAGWTLERAGKSKPASKKRPATKVRVDEHGCEPRNGIKPTGASWKGSNGWRNWPTYRPNPKVLRTAAELQLSGGYRLHNEPTEYRAGHDRPNFTK